MGLGISSRVPAVSLFGKDVPSLSAVLTALVVAAVTPKARAAPKVLRAPADTKSGRQRACELDRSVSVQMFAIFFPTVVTLLTITAVYGWPDFSAETSEQSTQTKTPHPAKTQAQKSDQA